MKTDNQMDKKEEVPGESRINAEHPNPNNPQEEDIYPKNKCNPSKAVDESFRIDDNSDYSTTATAENKCLDDPMVPGVGTSEKDSK